MAKILMVEDDRAQREMLRDFLTVDGHEVWLAENGDEALAQLREAASPFHLMITDIYMPEKNGIELIIELRREFSALNVIAISGKAWFDSPDVLAAARDCGATLTFQKPFRLSELRVAIKAVLGPDFARPRGSTLTARARD